MLLLQSKEQLDRYRASVCTVRAVLLYDKGVVPTGAVRTYERATTYSRGCHGLSPSPRARRPAGVLASPHGPRAEVFSPQPAF